MQALVAGCASENVVIVASNCLMDGTVVSCRTCHSGISSSFWVQHLVNKGKTRPNPFIFLLVGCSSSKFVTHLQMMSEPNLCIGITNRLFPSLMCNILLVRLLMPRSSVVGSKAAFILFFFFELLTGGYHVKNLMFVKSIDRFYTST